MSKPDLVVAKAAPHVAHDGLLQIATGRSVYETEWKNKTVRWSELLRQLSQSRETPETHAEYMKMSKTAQDRIKDIGGFVGGRLLGGRRKTGNVESRNILTLDLDYAPDRFPEKLQDNLLITSAYCVYSTHKHSPTSPRYRLIMPLNRTVTVDEYEAVGRKIAEKVGIDWFDDTTYQAARLMFWPSHSCDVAPAFEYFDAPFLDADSVLAEYPDWTDVSCWPESSRAEGSRRQKVGKQQDPTAKRGIVGAFCRCYTIQEAIETFLPEVYVPTGKEDRWTYAAGSTSGGLVIYDDGKLAYSNHGTDPAGGGEERNAFDLVRIHLFGQEDDSAQGKHGKDLPSYQAMARMAVQDGRVAAMLAEETRQAAEEDFREPVEDEDWRTRLRKNEKLQTVPSIMNAELILTFDPALSGIRYNEMKRRIDGKDLPWERPEDDTWRDADDAQLYSYVSKTYDVQFPEVKFQKALLAVADRRRYHPIREYLDGLPKWDGVERLDRLLVDYLGAEDTVYTREATRKCLAAAVTRIFRPGAKFDNVLVLQGPQGIGKSTLFAKLAGDWFSDNLSIADMRDKTGAERLQGYWIIEISEMTGMRKAEVEVVKSFISRQDDIYRAAYGRNTESHRRQCIVVGSTNDGAGFLRDITGNRRFWPVPVSGEGRLSPWALTQATVDQIWAEARICYDLGEDLILSREAEKLAQDAQREAMESDERQGIVEAYLDRLLPEGWEDMSADARMIFLEDPDTQGTETRMTVSNVEIWVEALGNRAKDMEPKDSRAITAMMVRIPGWEKTNRYYRSKAYGNQRIYRRKNATKQQMQQIFQ